MMVNKKFLFVLGSLLVLNSLGLVGSDAFDNSANYGFDGATNGFQSYQPTFNQLYSSKDISDFWPILGRMETEQCEATTDFIIGIPPGGCSPSVVRSDLLAEQNVPVFCSLYAIRINPLIKVSSIDSISFRGDYPEGVAGISYHPARAGVRSYKTLLGDPMINNIGYVVIILDREKVEDNLSEWIAGELTATIRYDAEEAYGVGRAEYYLPEMSDDEWTAQYEANGFWNGRGFVRLLSIEEDEARIGVYSSVDNLERTFTLRSGETSDLIYFPGFYCKAGLKVRLNSYVAPEDSALLNIDGEQFWVRKGTKILDNQCTVRNLYIGDPTMDGSTGIDTSDDNSEDDNSKIKGTVEIRCPGGLISLELNPRDEPLVDSHDEELSPGSIGELEFSNSLDTVDELINNYGSEKKDNQKEFYAEEALYEEIVLAGQLEKFVKQKELIDLFLDKYPTSDVIESVRRQEMNLGLYDYSNAYRTIFLAGEYHSIGVVELKDENEGQGTVDIRVDGFGRKTLKETGSLDIGVNGGRVVVRDINPRGVTLDYYGNSNNPRPTSPGIMISEGSSRIIGTGYDAITVEIMNIDVKEEAHVSIIPEIKHDRTEANFTFNVGIEKRAIQLSPEKTEEMLSNLNESIEKWENINNKLGKLIEGWKGACFATATILNLKTAVNGFDGETIARQSVMKKFKEMCDKKHSDISHTQCYNDFYLDEIALEVERYKEGVDNVNSKIEEVTKRHLLEGTFGNSIVDNEAYVKDLRSLLGNDWSVIIDGEPVYANNLTTTSQIRAALLYGEIGSVEGVANDISLQERDDILISVAQSNKRQREFEESKKTLLNSLGPGGVTSGDIAIYVNKDASKDVWSGKMGDNYGLSGEDASKKVQLVGNGNGYLAILTASGMEGISGISSLYTRSNNAWTKMSDISSDSLASEIQRNYVLYTEGVSNLCSNPWPEGGAQIRFYESGRNKGLPAVVPFDLKNGWYVMVPNSAGTMVEDSPKGYTDAADVRYLMICNIGANNKMENGQLDDQCQSFDSYTYSSSNLGSNFAPCGSLSSSDIQKLYNNAREAVRQAAQQYGNSEYNILGQKVYRGAPMSDVGDVECQDFMSPEDCKLMFNVCDPVICPSSRCDLGGKYPVSDVIQSGIIGSIALCLPNAAEGIVVPICLSGIHAGLDAYVSILDSERQCLQQNLEKGEVVGICDEITSIYKCEFFWGQVSPMMELLIPKAVERASGGLQGTKGGGEYLTIQHAWENLGDSVDFFKDTYAVNAFNAFRIKSVDDAGGEFCKSFIGTTIPTSAEGLNRLLEPESPPQFYAEFSTFPFTDATIPETSQYKVYYHIYSGNDLGVQYKVYLKDPPASGYYSTMQTLHVKTGFVSKGNSVDETVDFTAPAGYKELCVVINDREECGFRSVTTDLGIDYVKKKYIEEQASETNIQTEAECVSGTPSALPLASLNLQGGLQEAVNPEIGLRGIVRVCATSNPGGNVGQGARWKDVGYCGQTNLKCWLDVNSVEDDLKLVEALEGTTIEILDERRGLIEDANMKLEEVQKILSESRERIKGLTFNDLVSSSLGKPKEIIEKLNSIIGGEDRSNNENLGYGTNANRAEALSLKATIYRMIALKNYVAVIPIPKSVAREDEGEKEGEEGVVVYPFRGSLDTCQIENGNMVAGSAYNIKKTNLKINDKIILGDTGVNSFECLVLMIAMQESSLRDCDPKKTNNCRDCSNNNLLLSSDGKSKGIMQINQEVHGFYPDFNSRVEKGIEIFLNGYNAQGDEVCGYSGWKKALKLYNGASCNAKYMDYVNDVLSQKDIVKANFPQICGVGNTISNQNSDDGITLVSFDIEPPNDITSEQLLDLINLESSCQCGLNCKSYADAVYRYSKESNINPLTVLALMFHESKCDYSAKSSASSYGLMQISSGSYLDFCKGKLSNNGVSFEVMRASEDYTDLNIECGIKILKGKYTQYNQGLSENYFKTTSQDVCKDEEYISKYASYKGIEAALRAYNGWGCNPFIADVDFVENVKAYYDTIGDNYLSILAQNSPTSASA